VRNLPRMSRRRARLLQAPRRVAALSAGAAAVVLASGGRWYAPANVATAATGNACPPPSTSNAEVEEDTAGDNAGDWFADPEPEEFPVIFRVHTGAGAKGPGELHYTATGFLGSEQSVLDTWLMEYKKGWPALASRLRGWQPLCGFRALRQGDAPPSLLGSLRWSKQFLPEEGAEPSLPDGTGLDLHLETSVQASSSHRQLEQRAEVVFGPRAQAKHLNFSLPAGLKAGAVASFPDAQQAGSDEIPGARLGPLRFYAGLSWPGLSELRGWLTEANFEHRLAGLVNGQVQGKWPSKDGGRLPPQWFLQHLRTHGTVRLPKFVGNGLESTKSLLRGREDSLAPRPAVVPATKLRVGSEGPGAALGLESSQAGLGGSGWNGVVEVGRLGWGAKIALALGIADEGLGQPRYQLSAHGAWKNRTSLSHEFKWAFSDGQWVAVTVADGGPGRPPRVNLGVEVR